MDLQNRDAIRGSYKGKRVNTIGEAIVGCLLRGMKTLL